MKKYQRFYNCLFRHVFVLLMVSCSSEGEETTSENLPPPTSENPTTTITTYEDINQENLILDLTHVFTAGNDTDDRPLTKGGVRVPSSISFDGIREINYSDVTPESFEARKQLTIYSVTGQSKRIEGDDINVVGLGRNDKGIGNASITYTVDVEGDNVEPNGILTLKESMVIGNTNTVTPLNGVNGYSSRPVMALTAEFRMNEGDISPGIDDSGIETIEFQFNGEFPWPDGLYNFNLNGKDSDPELTAEVRDHLESVGEVALNIHQISIGTGRSIAGEPLGVITTSHY